MTENGRHLTHYLQNDFHQEIVFLRAKNNWHTAVNTQSVTIVWYKPGEPMIKAEVNWTVPTEIRLSLKCQSNWWFNNNCERLMKTI